MQTETEQETSDVSETEVSQEQTDDVQKEPDSTFTVKVAGQELARHASKNSKNIQKRRRSAQDC